MMNNLSLKSFFRRFTKTIRVDIVSGLTLVFLGFYGCRARGPAEVSLSDNGQALLSVVIGSEASDRTYETAGNLAEYLGRITGGNFMIQKGDGKTGIAVGSYKDFPALKLESMFDPEDISRRDEYLLRTHDKGVILVGATELAVQNAVWDFLYRIGFRQFFPGKVWEICPNEPNVTVSFDEFESPDFISRAIHGSGMELFVLPKTKEAFYQWRERNRMESGFKVSAGHAYHKIFYTFKEHFEAHPEDLVGTGENAKLDPTRPSVLKIVDEYAVQQFEENPDMDITSMEPSDGGGWREDSPLGSATNQVVTIANHAAKAIQKRFPGKKVGILGYNFHSAPPTIDVDPNVVVMVSEYAIREGLEFEPILKGWKKMGADVGVTNPVFNIYTYLHDLPGQGKASDLNLLAAYFPRYHELGARYWSGSSSPGWAPYGLGYYLISRFLWDTGEALKLEELLDDFYSLSFGTAASVMREYYENYLLASGKPLLSEDLIGRMYRKLEQAISVAESPEAVRRIESYIIHVRYLELYFAYKVSSGEDRQKNFEELARYAYSLRDCESDMISGFRAVNRLALYDKQISPFDEKAYEQDIELLKNEDLYQYLQQGIINNKLIDFTPVSFSTDLVPWIDTISPDSEQTESFTIRVGGTNLLYLYPDPGQNSFVFKIAGGLNYSNYGPVKLKLYAREHAVEEPVATTEVPSDKELHTVILETPYKGLHWLEFGDGGPGGSSITWSGDQHVALPASTNSNIKFSLTKPGDLFFFVPKGTNVVGGYSEFPSGQLVSPDGKVLLDFETMEKPGYFSTPVPGGQDGMWWKFSRVSRNKLLLTVPSYFTNSVKQGLIPREVMQAESGSQSQ